MLKTTHYKHTIHGLGQSTAITVVGHLNCHKLHNLQVLSLSYFLRWAPPYPMLPEYSFTRFRINFNYCLRNSVIRSYAYRILKATWNSRVGVSLGNLLILPRTLACEAWRWPTLAETRRRKIKCKQYISVAFTVFSPLKLTNFYRTAVRYTLV